MSQLIKSAILIKKEDRFLLVQENGARVRGLWNWPQGKVEEGETTEQAAVREAKEETGLNIKVIKSLTILKDTFSDIRELHVFLGAVLDGEIGFPENEIMNVQFFSFEEIERMKNKLVGKWVYNIIFQNK